MHLSIPAATRQPAPPPPPQPNGYCGHLLTNPHFENKGKYKTFLVLMSSFAGE